MGTQGCWKAFGTTKVRGGCVNDGSDKNVERPAAGKVLRIIE